MTDDKTTGSKMTWYMGIGIFLFSPLALITLKKGYSTLSRVISLGYLIFFVGIITISMTDPEQIEARRVKSEIRQIEDEKRQKVEKKERQIEDEKREKESAQQIEDEKREKVEKKERQIEDEKREKESAQPKGYGLGPPQQRFMTKLIDETKSQYTDDSNPAKKKRVWIKASKKLCSSEEFSDRHGNPFSQKVDWVGYVDQILGRDDGSVLFQVDIDKHGNEVQDGKLDDKLIDIVLDLKAPGFFGKGEFVKFSGYFEKGDMKENECLKGGLDSNPELMNEGFNFKFTKIEKIVQ